MTTSITLNPTIDDRIHDFISQLSQQKHIKDIDKLCESEVNSLRSIYAISTLKIYLKKYRDAAESLPLKKRGTLQF